MNFIQGDILDEKFVKKYFLDADIVHHLAGVTDVPRTKSESNSIKNDQIKSVGVEGTKNILKAISNKCKIIFPSTHVVYEGLEQVKKNIKEDEITKPVLSYSTSKAINEQQLKESGKNYIILRLSLIHI